MTNETTAFTRATFAVAATLALILAMFALLRPAVEPAEARGGGGSASCFPLDVALIIDDTGSMGGAIDNVRDGLGRIINQVKDVSRGNYQLSLVTFADTVEVDVPFSRENAAAVRRGLDDVFASGGGNIPEASDEALNTVVNGLDEDDRRPGQQIGDFPNFREPAKKIAVLVTDALPGGFNDAFTAADRRHAEEVARDAKRKGIRISAVYVPTFEDPQVRGIMKDYARISDGIFTETDFDGSGTARAIRETVRRCGGEPPEREPRLHVTVNPDETREDVHTCFTFTVTSGGDRIRGARVRFGGESDRTNSNGHARICHTFDDPGPETATATKDGFRRDRVTVEVIREPGFTG